MKTTLHQSRNSKFIRMIPIYIGICFILLNISAEYMNNILDMPTLRMNHYAYLGISFTCVGIFLHKCWIQDGQTTQVKFISSTISLLGYTLLIGAGGDWIHIPEMNSIQYTYKCCINVLGGILISWLWEKT